MYLDKGASLCLFISSVQKTVSYSTCVCVCANACVCESTGPSLCVNMCVCVCVCMCVLAQVCACMCAYLSLHIFIYALTDLLCSYLTWVLSELCCTLFLMVMLTYSQLLSVQLRQCCHFNPLLTPLTLLLTDLKKLDLKDLWSAQNNHYHCLLHIICLQLFKNKDSTPKSQNKQGVQLAFILWKR